MNEDFSFKTVEVLKRHDSPALKKALSVLASRYPKNHHAIAFQAVAGQVKSLYKDAVVAKTEESRNA